MILWTLSYIANVYFGLTHYYSYLTLDLTCFAAWLKLNCYKLLCLLVYYDDKGKYTFNGIQKCFWNIIC